MTKKLIKLIIMASKKELIEKYKEKARIALDCSDDIERNLNIAKRESRYNKDIIFDMERTRAIFLNSWSLYETFIEELGGKTWRSDV